MSFSPDLAPFPELFYIFQIRIDINPPVLLDRIVNFPMCDRLDINAVNVSKGVILQEIDP